MNIAYSTTRTNSGSARVFGYLNRHGKFLIELSIRHESFFGSEQESVEEAQSQVFGGLEFSG